MRRQLPPTPPSGGLRAPPAPPRRPGSTTRQRDPRIPTLVIQHNAAAQRFEGLVGDQLAWLAYSRVGHRYLLDHTWVPEELRGRGVAAQLVSAVLTEARQQNWRLVPRCSYVAAFLRKHPEFSDLVDTVVGE
ncbi:MAG: N-acetyltransferase [Verrucomicrobia bacterium]|nr:N-acetyltransferase [Verrucomicrobiota bacterium]